MVMEMASMSKSTSPAEVYSDDDYLLSSPGLQPFYPSWPQQEQKPDVDSDGGEEDINEPWAHGLRLRPPTMNTSLNWLSESMYTTDDESNPIKASWKDQLVLGHMATSHGFDAVIEAGRRRVPSLEANFIDVVGTWQKSEPQEGQLLTAEWESQNASPTPPRRLASIEDYRDRVLAESLDETLQHDRKRARIAIARQARPASQPENIAIVSHRKALPIRRRKVLPMVFENDGQTFSMSACPDTGSDVNAISLSAARRLDCEMELPEVDISKFCLANGQPAGAIGRVAVDCSFATGTPWHDSAISCVFHVFSTLAVPLIMGMQFLERTETFSKYQDRLVEEVAPSGQAIMVNSLGRPLKSLVCQLDGCNGLAAADTGSDLDFLSDSYARSRRFTIEEAYHELILADDSLALTCGVTRVPFVIGQVDEAGKFVSKTQIIEAEFFILENLSSDILIGQDTALELSVFTDHAESFIASNSHAGESVNIIRYKGKLEKAAAKAWRKLRGVRKDGDDLFPEPDIEREWEFEDQRENSRREVRKSEISNLHEEEKARAEAEETRRVRQYEAKKGKRWDIASHSTESGSDSPTLSCNTPFVKSVLVLKNKSAVLLDPDVTILMKHRREYIGAASSTASFVCGYPGCRAPPFQTQYLLNSHMNVHSSARPHYCPFKGCPRSEGGKGFRRKNEMIRHRLVHDVPGYTCPFCPEKDHRYPRPDNLQRHVRLHHPDMPKDHHLLREVLSFRPDGPKTGRSRRGLPG